MIYFSKQPVDYERIDRAQYDLLLMKKTRMDAKGRIEEFSSIHEFKDKLNKQLPYILSNHEYLLNCTQELVKNLQDNKTYEVQLSKEAVEILKLAGNSDDGHIMKLRHLAGLMIQVGGENLDTSSSRKEASYNSALNELLNYGLVEPLGHKGQIFQLTKSGWDTYDQLSNS